MFRKHNVDATSVGQDHVFSVCWVFLGNRKQHDICACVQNIKFYVLDNPPSTKGQKYEREDTSLSYFTHLMHKEQNAKLSK